MNKYRIGIDVDDVLARFMDVFVPWYNLKHNTNYRIEDFYDYDLRKVVLNGKKVCETQEEATKLVNEFYETQNFENLEPVYLSKETLPLIKSIYDVTIITSRPESLRKSTETWLNKYFEGLFDDVVLLGHYHGGTKTKAEICKTRGINTMIDDSLKHIQECIQQGVGRCILYNRPWNQEPLLKGATRVDSWYEISGILRPSVCISQH